MSTHRMEFPVRCYTCNAVLAHMWADYDAQLLAGGNAGAVLDALRVRRMCCRRMFLGHVRVQCDPQRHAYTGQVLDEKGTVLDRAIPFTRKVACD